MRQDVIVGLCMGAALLVVGFLLTTREGFARWGLTHGRGKIWVSLLGMERALKLTRYFFGPLVTVLGVVAVGFSVLVWLDPPKRDLGSTSSAAREQPLDGDAKLGARADESGAH